MPPQIISVQDPGQNFIDLSKTLSRLSKERAWADMSTIMIVPAADHIPTRVVAHWMNMQMPPNQNIQRLWAEGTEVGEAYSTCIDSILAHPQLSKFKYVFTMEHDNCPLAGDDLVRLLRQMEAHPEYAGIGGLYFTKGIGGVAQIWGDAKDPVMNFRPQRPDVNGGLVECCGTGMGFNAWRLSMFKDPKLKRPFFKTTASAQEGMMTQDLYFAKNARQLGYRFAVDCSIRIGHYDHEGKFGEPKKMW